MSKSDRELQTISSIITQLEGGEFDSECTLQLDEIGKYLRTRAMQGMKGKASLSITINFDLDRGSVDLTGDISVKMPKAKRDRSTVYLLQTGFSFNLPGQATLPLQMGAERTAGQAPVFHDGSD